MAKSDQRAGAARPADLETARRAMAVLAIQCRGASWCGGYGIAPAPDVDDGYVLRVNVKPGTPAADVPDAVEGVPVISVVMDAYRPRSKT